MHMGLSRCTAALSGVAGGTANNRVTPSSLTTLHLGQHVVERELSPAYALPAILALTAVTGEDVVAAVADGLGRLELRLDKLHNRGNLPLLIGRVHYTVIIILDDDGLSLWLMPRLMTLVEKLRHGLFPRDDSCSSTTTI